MGTRGLMGIRVNSQDKLAYNHFDSYPTGLGEGMVEQLNHILEQEGIGWLKEKAAALVLVDEHAKPTPEQIEQLKSFANLEVNEKNLEDWYRLLRKAQGELLLTLESGYMMDSHDFINDSLFCEWAYIINLDDKTFEVYRGFRKEYHELGRYASSKPDKEDGYYPCALIATYSIRSIPVDWAKELEGREK